MMQNIISPVLSTGGGLGRPRQLSSRHKGLSAAIPAVGPFVWRGWRRPRCPHLLEAGRDLCCIQD